MERRRWQRSRAFLGGRIVFNHAHSSLDCVVKEISDGGALIKVENAVAVPESFQLILNDGRSFACEIIWRKINTLGVSFAKDATPSAA